MNGVRAFVDTNVIAYLYSKDDELKRNRAYFVMKQYNCLISIQVLNEFSNLCIKKWKFHKEKILNLTRQICIYCDVAYIYEGSIEKALGVHEKYGYAYYDSLIIATALENDCLYLLSEDMADGQVIDGRLTIKNIFVHENF